MPDASAAGKRIAAMYGIQSGHWGTSGKRKFSEYTALLVAGACPFIGQENNVTDAVLRSGGTRYLNFWHNG